IFRLQAFDPSAASLSATSRSAASRIQKPARYSFDSTKGPSVNIASPPRLSMTVAASVSARPPAKTQYPSAVRRSVNALMAGCLSVLPGLPLSSITETRYCIPDHLLCFGAPSQAAAHPASAGCILRAPGRPIDLERYALREGPRFDQVKRHVRAGGGEQPRALADDYRDDEQIHLIDQVVLQQPPGQGAAAVHLQLTGRPGLQLADGRGEVTGQHGRIRPPRLGERGRRDVLGPGVQGICDEAAARIHRAPVAGEALVGPAAEQECAGALVHLVDERPSLVVEVPDRPSVALESGHAFLL